LIDVHCPGAESATDVNVIRLDPVPTAESAPDTLSALDEALPLTITPGSIVSVTPAATVTLLFRMYGLFAAVHVVFDEIVPDTYVGPAERAETGTIRSAVSSASATSRPTLVRDRPRRNGT
jgi:hypothetical protein